MKSRAFIAVGSNLGDRTASIDGAIAALAETRCVAVRQISSLRETEPVGGPPGQGKYLNGVALVETDLEPLELLRVLQNIESQFGRRRTIRSGARTLDLDLLLFDDRIIATPELYVPHPRMRLRRFVLEPLVEVDPAAVDPATHRRFAEILADLPKTAH